MDEHIWNEAANLESGLPTKYLQPCEQSILKAEFWAAFQNSLTAEQVIAGLEERGWDLFRSLTREQWLLYIAGSTDDRLERLRAAFEEASIKTREEATILRRRLSHWPKECNRCEAIREKIAQGVVKPREIVKALADEGITVSKALIARVKAREKENEARK